MNQALELQNNKIIFSRAAAVFKLQHGVLTEHMIDYLRNLFLISSWKIEAKELKRMRETLGMSFLDVYIESDVGMSVVRKVESAKDFEGRDATVKYLQDFYNMRLN
jgi:hypothetical protein